MNHYPKSRNICSGVSCRGVLQFWSLYVATPLIMVPSVVCRRQAVQPAASRLEQYYIFRCVRQERISIRGSVRPSVRPSFRPSVGRSVRPSVGPLRLFKNRVFPLLLATVRSYTGSNDRQTCFICLFVHQSLHICHMFSAKFNTRGNTVRTHRVAITAFTDLS